MELRVIAISVKSRVPGTHAGLCVKHVHSFPLKLLNSRPAGQFFQNVCASSIALSNACAPTQNFPLDTLESYSGLDTLHTCCGGGGG